MVVGEGLIEFDVGLELAVAHPLPGERMRDGHLRETAAERVGFRGPRGKRFRAMKREHAARARFRIAFVAKECLDAGGFVGQGGHRVCCRIRGAGGQIAGEEEEIEARRRPRRQGKHSLPASFVFFVFFVFKLFVFGLTLGGL